MAIRITKQESWEECAHSENGCSGREIITFVAEDPERGIFVESSASSCFGVDEDDLLTTFMRKVLAEYGITG